MASSIRKGAVGRKTAVKKKIAPTSIHYLQLYYTLSPDKDHKELAALARRGTARFHPDPINGTIPPVHPHPIYAIDREPRPDSYEDVPTRWTCVDVIDNPALPCLYEIAIRRVKRKK